MAYRTGVEPTLSRIGEQLALVVDAPLRQRLQAEYLGLLQLFHAGRRQGIERRAADLWNKVAAGCTQYRLSPSLGTIHGRFYEARDSALAVLSRLYQLAAANRDVGQRDGWQKELADLNGRLTMMQRQAEQASTNANLSLLDSLAAEASNYTAMHLLPRLHEWSGILNRRVPDLYTSGNSVAMTIAARPDLTHGLAEDLPAASGYQQLAAGIFAEESAATPAALRDAEGLWTEFKNDVKRAASLKGRLSRQKPVAEATPGDVAAADWRERERLYNNIAALLNDLAASLKTLTYDRFDEPSQMVASELAALDNESGGAILLVADQVREVTRALEAAEKIFDAADRRLNIAGGGLGLGKFAAAAVVAGLALYAWRRA